MGLIRDRLDILDGREGNRNELAILLTAVVTQVEYISRILEEVTQYHRVSSSTECSRLFTGQYQSVLPVSAFYLIPSDGSTCSRDIRYLKVRSPHTSRSLTRNVVDRHLRQEVTLSHVIARTVTTDRSAVSSYTIPRRCTIERRATTSSSLLETDEQVVTCVLERLAERYYHLVVHDREVTGNHDLRQAVPVNQCTEGSVLRRSHIYLKLGSTPVRSSLTCIEGQRGDRIPEDCLQLISRNDELTGGCTIVHIRSVNRNVVVGLRTIVHYDRVEIGRLEGDDCAICALTIQLTAICLHASVVGSLSGQTGQVSYRLGNVQHERVRHIAVETVLNLPCLCLTCVPSKGSDRTVARSELSLESGRSRTSNRRCERLDCTPITCAVLTTVRTYVYIIGMRCQEIREDVRSIGYINQVREGIGVECSDCIQSDLPCALTFLACTPRQFSRVCIDIRSSQVDRFETGQLFDADVIYSSRSLSATGTIVSPKKNHFVKTSLNSQVKRFRGPRRRQIQLDTIMQGSPTCR